jgi:hypothetical protein
MSLNRKDSKSQKAPQQFAMMPLISVHVSLSTNKISLFQILYTIKHPKIKDYSYFKLWPSATFIRYRADKKKDLR